MRGFVSYSHEDRKVCEALRKPLKMLCRMYGIEQFWIDDATPTGRCFRAGYQEAVDAASIHVILISANSLWSDTIMDDELPRIVERRRRHGTLALPVILDECLWPAVVGSLLASPRDDQLALKPLSKWRPLAQGVNRVGQEFSHAIAQHFNLQPVADADWKLT